MKPEQLFLTIQNCIAWTCADPKEGNDHHVLEIGELLITLEFMPPGYTGIYKGYKILTKFGIGFIYESILIDRTQKLS
jgi:hypothetical protein